MAIVTPNIGLQIPSFNQQNWQVPFNYDMNLLDLIFGGAQQVPALNVRQLTVSNISSLILAAFTQETPAGAVPGSTFTLSYVPTLLLAFFVNGIYQRPALDYMAAGTTLTTNVAVASRSTVYAIYLR